MERRVPAPFASNSPVKQTPLAWLRRWPSGLPPRRLNASINESRNQIRLRGGQYTTDLITARVEYGFSTIAFANALLQYNTDAQEWASNLRFNLIHHRLSDFFLVVNERRDSNTGVLIDRAFVAKMTYMVAF